jgi:hypothetical protein
VSARCAAAGEAACARAPAAAMPTAAAGPLLPAPTALVRAVAALTPASPPRCGAPSAAEADAHRTLAQYLDDPACADVAYRARARAAWRGPKRKKRARGPKSEL